MQVKYLMQPLHLEFRGLIIRAIMTNIQGISLLTQSIFPLFGLLGSWTASLETSFGSSTTQYHPLMHPTYQCIALARILELLY